MLAPPKKLTVSEWADRERRLSMTYSAEPGQWETNRAPYQRIPQDALTDPAIRKLTFMFASQTGKTEIEMNMMGHIISQDPGPMLWVWPTDELAENFSRERLAPTIAETPQLKKLVQDAKSRDSKNTITNKSFPGGYLALVGANAPRKLASRPIRYLIMDEIDGFPASAGTEGDPIKLALNRTTTFWNRRIVQVSTPTIKGLSAVEREFERGSMEKWQWQCPGCGEYQTENWDLVTFDGPKPVMTCPHCHRAFSELEWKRQPGRWHAEHPERKIHRSFNISALVSPWVSWTELRDEYFDARDTGGIEEMKVFVNTRLARTWNDGSGQIEAEEVERRRFEYTADSLPLGILFLTLGADVQDDRIEAEVCGWGMGYASWGVKYAVFQGDPKTDPRVWEHLDALIKTTWKRADGAVLAIMCTCIDSGGHCTSQVYRYTRLREARRVYAIKGRGGMGVPMVSKPSRSNREKAVLFTLGVDAIKTLLYSRLRVEVEGPDCCHWPRDEKSGYDHSYYVGLVSEERLITTTRKGKKVEWVKKKAKIRNEALDCRVYNTAAALIINPDFKALEAALNHPRPHKKKKTSPVYSRGVT
ncbi:phage terminase large subunit family protein [Pyramidobacter piscolens]|uniref:phage terminase large subunit family protein n=1 Tax=Pyramidobacter piscolens TaxID=638849 RepID=UPI00249192DB|nr:phage terminase large subunit family protein [Pyramidobacter piscolens]